MKRIRPAPMGRAYRYVRRIAHIEIALAERNKNGNENLATVVGGEQKAAAPAKKSAKKKAVAKKSAGKNKKKTAKAK
jgi:large subunit ribosomal protein L22